MSITKKSPELSLVVPLYNEASCIEQNVSEMVAYLEAATVSYEIVLVNDGSSDATETVCCQLAANNPTIRLIGGAENRGKGWSVKAGMLEARGTFAIFTDADLAVPMHFVGPTLEKLREGAPIVIGSRHLPDSSFKVREGVLRQFFGEIFRRLARLSLGLRVSDITCGFKGFNHTAAFDIFSRSVINRWGYDAEIIFLAQILHYPIQEIPVEWYHSFDSKVHVGIDSVRTLVEMLQIRRRHGLKRNESRREIDIDGDYEQPVYR